VTLAPQLAQLRVAATVDGGAVGVDGQLLATPAATLRTAGMFSRVTAPRQVLQDGQVWEFVRWTDSRQRSRAVLVPVAGRALTAIYRLVVTPPVFGERLIQA
jgi:hypothetical protein